MSLTLREPSTLDVSSRTDSLYHQWVPGTFMVPSFKAACILSSIDWHFPYFAISTSGYVSPFRLVGGWAGEFDLRMTRAASLLCPTDGSFARYFLAILRSVSTRWRVFVPSGTLWWHRCLPCPHSSLQPRMLH